MKVKHPIATFYRIELLCTAILILSYVSTCPLNAQESPPDATLQDDLGGLLEGLDLEMPPPEPVTIPDASGEILGPGNQGSVDGDDPAGSLFDIYQSMVKASQLLMSGQADTQVLKAQQRAVDLLDQMIAKNRQPQQSQSSTPSASQQQNSQQQDSDSPPQEGANSSDEMTEQSSDPQTDSDNAAQSGANQESESQPDEGGSPQMMMAGQIQPLDATGQGVWGHLPQKMRGMLRAEIPTDYLPAYSQQISDYFRALAEMDRER